MAIFQYLWARLNESARKEWYVVNIDNISAIEEIDGDIRVFSGDIYFRISNSEYKRLSNIILKYHTVIDGDGNVCK